MEKGKNCYNDRKITEEAENLIGKKIGLNGNVDKYLTKVKVFIVNKKFYKFFNKRVFLLKRKNRNLLTIWSLIMFLIVYFLKNYQILSA